MATTHIYLKGGPCDGRTVSADRIVGGLVAYIKCNGGIYEDEGAGTRPNGDLIWSYTGTKPPRPPGSGDASEPHVHKGWHDVRRSVNTRMPHSLAKVSHLTRQALRATSKGGRVRG